MYPWNKTLNDWAQATGLSIDALGLVTFIGGEEMDRSIGRLMPSAYFNHLPIVGAYIVAGDRFTEKRPGYTIYNISAGIMTTELAGWFSRWLQAQSFHQVRSKVTWEWDDSRSRPRHWSTWFVSVVLISLPLHGMLIAMTVLAADWWGFANAMAMIILVAVRCAQVSSHQAGIDTNIRMAEMEAGGPKAKSEILEQQKGAANDRVEIQTPRNDYAKVLVVMQDSKVVTLEAPGFLIRPAFTASPHISNRGFYLACRVIGWVAFGVHVITIGMAALHSQIYSVVLIVGASVLTGYKVGSEDSQLLRSIWNKVGDVDNESWTCWVTPRLKATVSSYPVEYTQWDSAPNNAEVLATQDIPKKAPSWSWRRGGKKRTLTDVEHSVVRQPYQSSPVRERRQDLYAWLDLTDDEDEQMVAWGLMPRSQKWKEVYLAKKEAHRQRSRRETH
ncbi:hypothetical protein BJX76DRAFT_358080 [Aspergillus varians]